MSQRTSRAILGAATASMAIGLAALTGVAAGASADADGSATVFVPAALNPHELCVSSATTGKHCTDVPGAPAANLTVSFHASANATPPSASVARCAGGAIVTVASGGGTLTGSATVSGLTMAPVTTPFGPTTTPGDTVVVSFCDK